MNGHAWCGKGGDLCGDRCEEDGAEQWHGQTFPLGRDGTGIALATHSDGTVEVIASMWLTNPDRDRLAAALSGLVAAIAVDSPIAEPALAPIARWAVAVTRRRA